MTIDKSRLDRYRKISSFIALGSGSDYERNAVLQQAIQEFDWYQKYSPNTHRVYVNGATTPILATFIDVSDLEVTTDSKWMLTSLKNDIKVGDSILWGNRMWMCIYDKEKGKIVLYYAGELTEKDLMKVLKEKLPRYMLPNKIERLEKMPLTANGKLDRVFLANKHKNA